MKKLMLCMGLAAMLPPMLSSCHKKEATPQPPVRVVTMAVTPEASASARTYTGTVEGGSEAAVSFSAPGTIQTLNINAGDRVARGQTIGTLDGATLRNAWEISKATLATAQDAYDRMKQLHDAGALTDMKWVEVQNTLAGAQSAEAISRKAMGDATLTSPISGYVTEKYVEAGMNIAPGIPVAKIVTIDPVKVSIPVTDEEIAAISIGTPATVSVSATGTTLSGKVTEKGVSANPLTRAYDVKIELSNPDGVLLPGMICDVTLQGIEAPGQSSVAEIVLPLGAVLVDFDNSNYVWLDSCGYAVRRNVKAAALTDAGIVVADGLLPGDSVIVEGMQKVSRMSRVNPITNR